MDTALRKAIANARALRRNLPTRHAGECRMPGKVPCTPFLTTDSQAPNHICFDALLESTERYVIQSNVTGSPAMTALGKAWPVPGDRRRIQDWVQMQKEWLAVRASPARAADYLDLADDFQRNPKAFAARLRDPETLAAQLRARERLAVACGRQSGAVGWHSLIDIDVGAALPLLGKGADDALIGLAIVRQIAGATVTLLGLVSDTKPATGVLTFRGSRIAIEADGRNVDAFGRDVRVADADAMAQKLNAWFGKTLVGRLPGHGGRPKWSGGTFRTAEACRAALVAVITVLQNNGQPLTEEEAAAYFQKEAAPDFPKGDGTLPSVDARQIRRWLDSEHLNITWAALVADATTR